MRARSQSGIQVTAGLVTLFKPSTDHGGVIYATLNHKYSPKRVCAHFSMESKCRSCSFFFYLFIFLIGMFLLSVWWNLTLVVALKVTRCVVCYNNMSINLFWCPKCLFSCAFLRCATRHSFNQNLGSVWPSIKFLAVLINHMFI